MTTTLSLAEDREAAIDKAADILSSGSVVVMPVGGVYAIVADAFRAAATQRIFAARRRSRATPLPVLLRSERQVGGMAGDVPEYADRLMAAYWPGDLTLILPASQDLAWDLGNAKGTVQLRLPPDELLRDLIGRVGPLACTAANRLSQDRPTTAEEARTQLGVLVPVYLDGGPLDGHVSTIVDATGPSPVIAREGVIAANHVLLVADGEVPWGEQPDPEEHPPVTLPLDLDEAEAQAEDIAERAEDLADRAAALTDAEPQADPDAAADADTPADPDPATDADPYRSSPDAPDSTAPE